MAENTSAGNPVKQSHFFKSMSAGLLLAGRPPLRGRRARPSLRRNSRGRAGPRSPCRVFSTAGRAEPKLHGRIGDACALRQVRRLPVVENGRLVGIVAQADIALREDETKTGALVEAIPKPSGKERR
jgi:CBS domain-containing protein